MSIESPSKSEVGRLASSLGLTMSEDELETYRVLVEGNLAGLRALDDLPDEPPPIRYPRGEIAKPAPEDNPLGAWYVLCRIEGAPSGKLAGKTVAVKDTVLLAGVPLANGSSILEGYTPTVDAVIVERMLDAGAIILGKSVCEMYCFSGGSHTAATGPVRNPHDSSRSAGGSSSGSGALAVVGEVDLAIGCDQGGSIRIPSSFCGVYGMKATHGLVPYTGVLGMDPTIDHVGPMTGTVADNALALEVLAGSDGVDSRQYSPRTQRYTQALGQSLEGLRIGVLEEGFGTEGSEPDVDEKVREGARRLAELGATVNEASVPLHALGAAVGFARLPIVLELMFQTDGFNLGRQDPVELGFIEAQRRWRDHADELAPNLKLLLLMSQFVKEKAGFSYAAKAENQVRHIRQAYDQALEDVDLLLLPTTPMKATPLPPANASPEVVIGLAFGPLTNTMAFDNTHHPAMSVPCGVSEGLPVGMMLVGRHFDESTIYRAAHGFEQSGDWRSF